MRNARKRVSLFPPFFLLPATFRQRALIKATLKKTEATCEVGGKKNAINNRGRKKARETGEKTVLR